MSQLLGATQSLDQFQRLRLSVRMSKNLNEAAMAGNLEEVILRLNLGEDVNQISRKNSTPLHDATTCGRTDIAKLLIER